MKNTQLGKELKDLITNKANIKVSKGNVSGNSIEIVTTKAPISFDSFIYNGNVADRDADYEKLEKELAA